MGVCIDKKVLRNEADLRSAFDILDYNGDGDISLEDFKSLFGSDSGSAADLSIWQQLLAEADTNGDGTICFDEFRKAMSKTLKMYLDDPANNAK